MSPQLFLLVWIQQIRDLRVHSWELRVLKVVSYIDFQPTGTMAFIVSNIGSLKTRTRSCEGRISKLAQQDVILHTEPCQTQGRTSLSSALLKRTQQAQYSWWRHHLISSHHRSNLISGFLMFRRQFDTTSPIFAYKKKGVIFKARDILWHFSIDESNSGFYQFSAVIQLLDQLM